MTSTTEHTAQALTSGTFYMTVTQSDGSVQEGICTEAQAARSLATAVRRGYFVEVLPNGGANIVRHVPGRGRHVVTLTPTRKARKLTPTARFDLKLIETRHRSDFDPETGRIKAGYVNSIPPAASALLMARGLVTVTGTSVTVSLSARLAMLAQDHRTETGEPRGYHREVGVIGPWRKGGCVYDRSSVAHCACHWSYPAEDRDRARHKAHEHRQEVTAAFARSLADGVIKVPA